MRIRISQRNSDIIDTLTTLFNFKFDGTVARIAFAISLQTNKIFDINSEVSIPSDGKDWRDERALFGASKDEKSHFILYRSLLDQHYNANLSEEQFVRLFKLHLDFGLEKLASDVNEEKKNGTPLMGLMKSVKKGLDLISDDTHFSINHDGFKEFKSVNQPITITLGKDSIGNDVQLRINDLNEFDSCNIAIAGMVGSGKTELLKDLLLQISKQTKNELKFIFFDYKGEANSDRLKPFLDLTRCKMVDLRKEAFEFNPLSFISLDDDRTRLFNIKSLVDFICTIATQLGANQKHILQTVITECFDSQILSKNIGSLNTKSLTHPTFKDIYDILNNYNNTNERKPDSLDAILADLSTSIFQSEQNSNPKKIYEQSLYINLPLELSDTLRQLCVFLTLKYLLAEFSSSNDTEPTPDRIKPLRYIIVIDEAHVYLKNKNASKALEDILRVLRSKGIIIILLTQGVEDYKTKNFDFSSQIKIPICLNINNKDYKLIEAFIGTPRSKQKLQEAISKLEPQKALININDPQIISINQFWKTSIENLDS